MAPTDSAGGPNDLPGLQPERTTLAWERTAIAITVAGVVVARQGAVAVHLAAGLIGVAQAVAGGALLAWALRSGHDVDRDGLPRPVRPQVGLTRLVGAGSVIITVTALGLGLWSALS